MSRAAQGVGSSVFGADLGALGSGERLRCGVEFGAQVAGGLLGGGFEQFAECCDVGLGVGVVGQVGVETVEGIDGLMPRGARVVAAGGGVFFGMAGFEAGLDFGQGEVGGDLASGVVNLLAGLVDVAWAADCVAEEVA